MASLYELSAGYASLLDAYDSADTEEERGDILEIMAEAEGNIAERAEAYAKIIRMKDAEAKAFKEEAKRLTAKAAAAENVVKRLKEAVLDAMKLADVKEIPTSIGKWRVQMNPWKCEIRDIDEVPEEWHIRQPDTVDRKALIDWFKETGELVKGVEFTQDKGVRFR